MHKFTKKTVIPQTFSLVAIKTDTMLVVRSVRYNIFCVFQSYQFEMRVMQINQSKYVCFSVDKGDRITVCFSVI